jgi:diacylglycerol O-acyltransferase / wax synthase
MPATEPIPMLDLMFFLTESVDNPRHVGSVLIFQKPRRDGARSVQEIVDAYRAARPKAPFNRIPVFRKPGMPSWQEVDDIDASHHVRHLALPAPGSNRQLHELIADLHAPMLERHRPGWKLYVIDGLEGDRFALYHKCHHALVDGESGMDILRRSLAESPADRTIRATVTLEHAARPRPAPRGLRTALEREARILARRTLSIGMGSLYLVEQALGGLRGYTPKSTRAFTAPHTPMNEPIYNSRSITHTTLPLDRMKSVAHRAGATLNDVTLCVLDAAVNRYLREHGTPPAHPLVALCPVSLRDDGAKEATTNVSAIWPPLGPVNSRIDRRLHTIAANTRTAKADLKSLGKDVAYAYAVMAFALSETLTIAKPEILGLLPANMLVSNVRGPDRPMYLNGARLEALFPVSTLIVGVGLNVTFMSYAGQVVLGFTANGAALPDIESLGCYANDAFEQLERITAARPLRRRRTRSRDPAAAKAPARIAEASVGLAHPA